MARNKKHEEHVNAEAWAIPYGDLVTLLFALFTVLYAVSSVNDGKFRVLSDSMIAAFQGPQKSIRPINEGEKEDGKDGDEPLAGISPTVLMKAPRMPAETSTPRDPALPTLPIKDSKGAVPGVLVRIEKQIQEAMQELIAKKLVTVKRESLWVEVEINTDLLFPSGSGDISTEALPVLDRLAGVLAPFPNSIRVEGHTDDRPIKSTVFPSNWELSAARAASVVHEFTKSGIDPLHLEIVGFGQYRPLQPNDTVAGRNANRRVAILILEAAVPGAAATASASDDLPNATSSGATAVADTGGAENRVMVKVPVDELAPTVPGTPNPRTKP
jgi:chemotaxis protein MotB